MTKVTHIGNSTFRTQTEALEHFKSMLHRYKDGDKVDQPKDHEDLVALIERYDRALESAGEPVKGDGQVAHFERRLNGGEGWSSSGFWLVRNDGHSTDFSYIAAVKGKPKSSGT